MDTILDIWRWLQLLGVLIVPQLLGLLIYCRIRKHHDFLAHLAGFVIPPVLFFYLTRLFLLASAQEIQSQGERVCGTAAGMMALVVLFGTGLQLFFSLLTQLALHARHLTTRKT
jgi:hypothetical protein